MTITSRLKPAAFAVVGLLASCGGDDSSAPSASLLAAHASADASSSDGASAATHAADNAAAGDIAAVHGGGAVSMHLQWSSPGASRTNLVRVAGRPLTDALAR